MDEKDVKSSTNINQDSNVLLFEKLNNTDDLNFSCDSQDATNEKENHTGSGVSNEFSNNKSMVSDNDLSGLKINVDKETKSRKLGNEVVRNESLLKNTEFASLFENTTDELDTSKSVDEISAAKDSVAALNDKNDSIIHQSNVKSPIESVSDSEIAIVERDVEIVPDNVNVGQICDLKSNFDKEIDSPCLKTTDNDEEEIIFNFKDQIENEIAKDADNPVNGAAVPGESLKVESENLIPPDHSTFGKSIVELSTTGNKPNSLAEDAKLVKFSVSTKSVNLMQSNAQFLNKSRNFLNFITEKSTNIMEKTLLPQNLAAKCNSILKLTENNPTNYKKPIEENPAGSYSTRDNQPGGSELNYEGNNQIPFHVTKLHSQDTESKNSSSEEQGDESSSDNYNLIEDHAKEDQKLFLKCTVNENECDNMLKLDKQDTEIKPPAGDSGSVQLDLNIQTTNMMEEGKINSPNLNNAKRNIDSDLFCKGSEISKTEDADEMDVTKKDSVNNTDIAANVHNYETKQVSVVNFKEDQRNNEQDSIQNLKEETIDLELLAHPAYVTLLRDYTNLKDQNVKLSVAMTKAEKEKQRLESENNKESHALQLEEFEKTIEQLKHDLKQSNASQELINKEYILANKERESMVMKYAISEKQLIDTQRAREYAERKVNEALKEQELLHTKLKQVHGERTRICNILDSKCHELTDAQKEVERLKEELNMREVKLKWTQNKLKTELDAFKENQQKLDKAMLRINEMKEECEQVRKESHETIRKFQQSEENKVVTLDHQLKEQQARLILERHVTEDKEMSRLQLQKEVETLKQRQHALIEENNTLSLKVQNLEKERLNYENNLSNLKIIADQRQTEILDLVGKVSELETLKLQLQHKEQLLSSIESEVERLRQSNAELQSDMEWCREREAHMLDFTEKLTDKNVRLQSEFTAIEAKNEQLELEQGPLQEEIKELNAKVKSLEISLASEKSKRTEECELLARHVAEQTQLARNLSQKLEDSQGENAVLRRKQQISVKEMTKELQQCKKRLDAFETGSPSNSLDRTSRTGSSSSLSTGETLNGAVSDNSNSGDNILQSVEPDQQTLIDRIVKLQRIRVRQAEKLDFLEEHTRTLVNELQKKTKIIKNYILHENSDAMGSNERDRNKAELARHGGIMASVYNQRVSDDNMTLELSLEMNQKLQAVLEDTLLKNITLKDSIDTLGGEIARLTMQNQRRH